MTEVTVEKFKEYFDYDHTTGILTLIKARGRKDTPRVGKQAGWVTQKGYLGIIFRRKFYAIHRLGWFMHYGVWPQDQIDHINRDKQDNRIENLRVVDNRTNQHNTASFNGGAFWQKHANKWRSQIKVNGKTISLGYFDSETDARNAYSAKLKEISDVR